MIIFISAHRRGDVSGLVEVLVELVLELVLVLLLHSDQRLILSISINFFSKTKYTEQMGLDVFCISLPTIT